VSYIHQFQTKDIFPDSAFTSKNQRFMDVLIDGQSIYNMLKEHGMIPCLGWGPDSYRMQNINYFLTVELHPDLGYQYPLMVCPWCGDEECGFISVLIERKGNVVIWKDFKVNSDNQSLPLGPFTFKWEEYEREIRSTYNEHR